MKNLIFKNKMVVSTVAGALLAAGLIGGGIANSKININLDGKLLTQTKEMGVAYINDQHGRTMVPLRLVSEGMGYEVKWDGPKQTATIIENGTTVKIAIGSKTPTVNNAKKTIDAPAVLKDGRTYVPVRFISEAMGEEVKYENKTVFINTDSRIPLPEVPAILGKATYNNAVDFKVITDYFGDHQYPGVSTPLYLDNGNNIVFMVDPYQAEWDKGEPFDVQIKIKKWTDEAFIHDVVNKGISTMDFQIENNQTPKSVLKRVLEFYLPNGADRLYTILDDGYNDRLTNQTEVLNKDLQHKIGTDGKKVQIVFDEGLGVRIYK